MMKKKHNLGVTEHYIKEEEDALSDSIIDEIKFDRML